MKNISIIIFLFVSSGFLLGQDKQLHFAHGLSGSSASWADLENRINSACPFINTTNGTYNSTDGIQAYSDEFTAALTGIANSNDIAIGHSFGGIVLRALDEANTDLFGGYITVATPHAGAQLANSVNDGLVENYLEDGCSEVIDDPITAATNTLLSSPLTFLFGVVALAVDNGATVLCDNLWELTLEAEGLLGAPFTGTNGQTIEDLEVGGAGSNLSPSSLPSVGITGEANEEDEVHWKLLEDRTGSNVTATMTGAALDFRSAADELIGISGIVRKRWWLPPTWIFGGLSGGLINTAGELDEAAAWIENSEEGWIELIGAGGGVTWVPEIVDVPALEPCLSDGQCEPNEKCIEQRCVQVDGGVCDMSPQQTTTITIMRPIPNPDLPNDGVVTVASQLLPGSLTTESRNGVTHFGEQTDNVIQETIGNQLRPISSVNPVFSIPNCDL